LKTLNNNPNTNVVEKLIELCASSVKKEPYSSEINEFDILIDYAKMHRVTSVIQEITVNQKTPISHNLNKELSAINKKSKLKMLLFLAEISSICSTLKQKSIRVIPLKGPVAAKQIYNDYTAKNSRDIDLLIQLKHLDQIIESLEQLGYSCPKKYKSLSKKQQKVFQESNNQLTFFNHKKKVQLEIHWRLFANSHYLPITFDKLIKDGSEIIINKTAIYCLSNKHLLFYLCAHGAKHHWALLYWLMELANLVENKKYDWESILKEAIEHGVERPVVQGLILVETLFSVPAPSIIQEYHQRHSIIQDIVKTAIQRIHGKNLPSQRKTILNYLKTLVYKMKLKSDISYKLAFWNPISPNDFELVKLPDPLFFGYFWLRPFFWFWRYIILPIKKQ